MAASGADIVKVQTYRPESLCLDIDNDYFGKRKKGLWKGRTLWSLYQEAALPYEWHQPLQELTHELGMEFFSSPFDLQGVDFLEKLKIPYYKIASFEINHIPLIEKAARTGKPLIISTGVADDTDIQLALNTCYEAGNFKVALLKCTSQYPANLSDANLRMITDMQHRFKVPIGLSDHTMGSLVPITAVSLGARIIEKHFTLNRNDGGADAAFSMEPNEFSKMVEQIRSVESCLGEVNYSVTEEDKLRRRSIFYSRNISIGEVINKEDIKVLRNGSGLEPKYMNQLPGVTLARNVKIGEPVLAGDLLQKD
ncbi:N-acetylneuraminic acid synthase [Shewanella saliphila]|uniref:N-acetylneuraminic acid synthase n=2 Tax=Shewanella saliphila TaxID=2282698 RepID=A0ABQ2Q2R7_9GAMM|nr:N-acetylneuraminic acid synthase [Shewanella saliphila]